MVYAGTFIAANKAADLVNVKWSSGKAATVSEADIQKRSRMEVDPAAYLLFSRSVAPKLYQRGRKKVKLIEGRPRLHGRRVTDRNRRSRTADEHLLTGFVFPDAAPNLVPPPVLMGLAQPTVKKSLKMRLL
jgi:hypothetical protein